MARALTLALLALLADPARAACVFTGGEIANPFDPGCGDNQFTYTETQDDATHIALGYPVPMPVASLAPVAGFREYASLHARHEDLALTSGGLVTSHVVGTTRAGREVFAYRIGDADTARPAGGTEGAVLVNGGIHAREWQSPESVTELLERLALNAGDGGFHQYLIENLTTVLLPVMNIDGFLQTQRFGDRVTAHPQQPREGRMRRKNLRHPAGGTVDEDIDTTGDNFYGVDLNRNNPVGYGQNGGSSGSATSLIYRGTAPASEPETLALRAAAALAPEARLRMYSDTHSFTRAYLISSTGSARLTAITHRLVDAMRGAAGFYGRVTDAGGGDIGTTADYFNETYRIPAWTLEIEPVNGASDYGGSGHAHGGFITPDAHITRVRDELARMYLMGLYRQAGPPAVREAMIRDAGGALVHHARWAPGAGNARTLETPVDGVLQPGVAYTLWIAFDKPMRLRDAGGAVTNFGLAIPLGIDVALDPEGAAAQSIDDTLTWHDQPQSAPGAGDGYLRYRDDAATLEFTLPDFSGDGARMTLEIAAVDLSNQSLDGDPATVADWSDGHWTGYEDADGDDSDVGGADDTLELAWSIDGNPPPASSGSSGSGAVELPFTVLLLLAALARLRRLRYPARA